MLELEPWNKLRFFPESMPLQNAFLYANLYNRRSPRQRMSLPCTFGERSLLHEQFARRVCDRMLHYVELVFHHIEPADAIFEALGEFAE